MYCLCKLCLIEWLCIHKLFRSNRYYMVQNKLGEKKNNSANLGLEETLWQAADKMRGHMDSAEYKHVVLGLIFLKYISDAFEERRSQLEEETADPANELYAI